MLIVQIFLLAGPALNFYPGHASAYTLIDSSESQNMLFENLKKKWMDDIVIQIFDEYFKYLRLLVFEFHQTN